MNDKGGGPGGGGRRSLRSWINWIHTVLELDPKGFGVKHDNSRHFILIFFFFNMSLLQRNKMLYMNLGQKIYIYFFYIVMGHAEFWILTIIKKIYIFFYQNSLKTFYFGEMDSDFFKNNYNNKMSWIIMFYSKTFRVQLKNLMDSISVPIIKEAGVLLVWQVKI